MPSINTSPADHLPSIEDGRGVAGLREADPFAGLFPCRPDGRFGAFRGGTRGRGRDATSRRVYDWGENPSTTEDTETRLRGARKDDGEGSNLVPSINTSPADHSPSIEGGRGVAGLCETDPFAGAARTGVSVPSVVKGKVSNRQDPTGVEFTDAGRAGLNHPADALAIGTPCLIPSTDLLLLQKGSFDPRLCPKPKNRHIPRSSGLPLRKSTARRKFRHRERSTSPSAPFVGQIQPPSSNSFLANTSICPGTHDRGFPSIHGRRRRAPTTAAAGR